MRSAVAKVSPPFGLDNPLFSLYHALRFKRLAAMPLSIGLRLFFDVIVLRVIISSSQQWSWFARLLLDGPDHFLSRLPGCCVTVRPNDRPGFDNRNCDRALDNGLHGQRIQR